MAYEGASSSNSFMLSDLFFFLNFFIGSIFIGRLIFIGEEFGVILIGDY